MCEQYGSTFWQQNLILGHSLHSNLWHATLVVQNILFYLHLGKLFFLFRKVYIYTYIYIYTYWGWSPNVVRMLQFTQILPSFWLAYWFCMNRGYLNFKSINPRVYPGLSSYFFSRSNGCCGVSTHFKTANKLRSSSGHVDLPVASQIILKSHD